MKAILVIDMPSNCKDCNKLVRKGCLKGDYRKEQRPKACPLKPLPHTLDDLDLEVWESNKGKILAPIGLFDELIGEKE